MKPFSLMLAGFAGFFILTSCDSYTYDKGSRVRFDNLFPVQNSFNWWEYSDDDGNRFSIRIVDVVTDDNDTYYKAHFKESKLQSEESHWFKTASDELLYSESLSSPFMTFLPRQFRSTGGEFKVDDIDVSYQLHNNYNMNGKQYREVVELNYDKPILNGFSRIVFADNVGPLQFMDDRGRWPVEYDLDSVSINGVVQRF